MHAGHRVVECPFSRFVVTSFALTKALETAEPRLQLWIRICDRTDDVPLKVDQETVSNCFDGSRPAFCTARINNWILAEERSWLPKVAKLESLLFNHHLALNQNEHLVADLAFFHDQRLFCRRKGLCRRRELDENDFVKAPEVGNVIDVRAVQLIHQCRCHRWRQVR